MVLRALTLWGAVAIFHWLASKVFHVQDERHYTSTGHDVMTAFELVVQMVLLVALTPVLWIFITFLWTGRWRQCYYVLLLTTAVRSLIVVFCTYFLFTTIRRFVGIQWTGIADAGLCCLLASSYRCGQPITSVNGVNWPGGIHIPNEIPGQAITKAFKDDLKKMTLDWCMISV